VRGREQVDGRELGQDLNVGLLEERIDELFLDGAPGGIRHVEDAACRVGRFARTLELIIRRERKGHLVLVDQQFADQAGPLVRQNRHGLRAIEAIAGSRQVFCQLLRRILLPGIDDATLGIVGIGFQRIRHLGEHHDAEPLILSQIECCRGPCDAATDDQYVALNGFGRHMFLSCSIGLLQHLFQGEPSASGDIRRYCHDVARNSLREAVQNV